jgi:hypothetical protein
MGRRRRLPPMWHFTSGYGIYHLPSVKFGNMDGKIHEEFLTSY